MKRRKVVGKGFVVVSAFFAALNEFQKEKTIAHFLTIVSAGAKNRRRGNGVCGGDCGKTGGFGSKKSRFFLGVCLHKDAVAGGKRKRISLVDVAAVQTVSVRDGNRCTEQRDKRICKRHVMRGRAKIHELL